MRKFIPLIFCLILTVATFWPKPSRIPSVETVSELTLPVIQKVFPRAHSVEFHPQPFPYCSVYEKAPDSETKTLKGFAFRTTDLSPDILGYAGPIVLLVGVDPSFKIQGIQLLEHHETRAYAYGIEKDWWLKQFIGLGPDADIVPDQDIDSISSATVTVSAVCQAVRESLRKIASQIQTIPGPIPENASERKSAMLFRNSHAEILLPLFFAGAVSYLVLKLDRRFRYGLLAVAFLYLGIRLKMLYSMSHLAGLLEKTLPGFQIAAGLWIFLALVLISSLLLGRIYCGYLCPFGALQELLAELSPWKISVSSGLDHWLKTVRNYLLWLLLIISLFYPFFEMTHYEPFLLTFTLIGPACVWIFSALVLLFSAMIERFYCRYFCFAGASLGFLSQGALTSLAIRENCALCNQRETSCPMQAIACHKIDIAECILCNRCRRECPKGNIRCAVRFKIKRGPATAKKEF